MKKWWGKHPLVNEVLKITVGFVFVYISGALFFGSEPTLLGLRVAAFISGLIGSLAIICFIDAAYSIIGLSRPTQPSDKE